VPGLCFQEDLTLRSPWRFALLIQVLACLSGQPTAGQTEQKAELPNPASLSCTKKGGKLEIRKDSKGGEYGVCIFPDGRECEEWAFIRDQCSPEKPADPQVKVDAEAVWQPGIQFMQSVRQACSNAGSNYGDCLISQMPGAGAPPKAVAFSKLLEKQSDAQIGYMTDFRKTGRVDIAYVYYPIRANENQGCLLVNGSPPIIDVDDLKLLAEDSMKSDPSYTSLASKNPEVAIFPGDRGGTAYPEAVALPQGGQRFIVSYYLLKGCHACARLGTASFGFDFDSAGKFLGTKFLKIGRLPGSGTQDK
jgi:putative hemolysin